jgi:hypothetical protein
MLNVACGDQTVGRTQVFEWVFMFRSCVTSPKGADYVRCMKSKINDNVDCVKGLLFGNRRVATHEAGNMLGIRVINY